jgi:septum formation protein
VNEHPHSLWRPHRPLVLASRSEARLSMLERAGIRVETAYPHVDERSEEQAFGINISPRLIAMNLAKLKAFDVAKRKPDRIVLGSDQTLELDGTTHSKAQSMGEARARLLSMSGRTHELHSAYTLACNNEIVASGIRTAKITVRSLNAEFIDAYLEACGESVLGSVACYRVEELGAQLLENIEGDWFTVLGLPLMDVLSDLRNSRHLLS